MVQTSHLHNRPDDSHGSGHGKTPDLLRDFSTDRRLLVLSGMALFTGLGGAAAAFVLQRLIALVTNLAYLHRVSFATVNPGDMALGPVTILIPVAGALIIGLMARFGSEKIRGHGIPEAMEAILIGKSRIQPKVALLKPLSSAISIGTGGPFGAEGPIIMTGGAIGSLIAQLFHFSSAERKTLLVAGAAAGMSATFGTPIAAILLAVELLLFEWKPRSFIPVAIAAAVAAGFRPWMFGAGPLFPMPASADLPALGLVACAAMGIIAGLGSGALTAMVYGCEDAFARLPIHWMWWPILGGVVIGVGGVIDPHALGVGYDNIAALLAGDMSSVAAARLLAVKSVIWAVALGSGTSGGVLAPLLMMGGALGLLVGSILPVGEPSFWALIGMAAIMGGTMRAPLTAMIFALELTHNVNALLPLAIACAAAHGTTVLLLRRSILTEKIARHGNHVTREYIVDPFEFVRVGEVMAQPVDTLRADMPVAEAITFLSAGDGSKRHKSYPVTDDAGRLVGMVSRADALRWSVVGDEPGASLAERVGDTELLTGYADELVGALADRMAADDVGRVPILRRADRVLVGLVARRDLLRVRAHLLRQETEREGLIRLGSPTQRRPAAGGTAESPEIS